MKNTLLHLFAGTLLLGLTLWQLDLDAIAAALKGIGFAVLAGIALGLVAFHLLKSLRWRAILRAQDISYSFGGILEMYWSGLFLGVVTPGRLGDLVRVAYLKQDGIATGRAAVGVVVDRLLDLGTIGLLALGSWLYLVWGRAGTFQWGGLAGVLQIAGWRNMVRQFLTRLVPGAVKESLVSGWQDFANDLQRILYTGVARFEILAYTGLAWTMYVFLIHFLVGAAGLEFTLGRTVLFFAVAAAASLLPLSVAGIGTRDLSLVGLAGAVGIEAEKGLIFSCCMLLLHALTALIGMAGWMRGRRLTYLSAQT